MKNNIKIIWHFKGVDSVTHEEKEKITFEIKQFYESSLVVFGSDIEITIIKENNEDI